VSLTARTRARGKRWQILMRMKLELPKIVDRATSTAELDHYGLERRLTRHEVMRSQSPADAPDVDVDGSTPLHLAKRRRPVTLLDRV